MKSKFRFVFFIFLLTTSAHGADLGTIVAASYPPRLVELMAVDSADGERPVGRFQSYASFEFDGERVLLAAYTDGSHGRVRALTLGADGTLVRITEPDLTLWGQYPRVRLEDLNDDKRPEMIVTVGDDHGEITWIFEWNRGVLSFLSPDPADPTDSSLVFAEFVDIDGDGVKEILNTAKGEHEPVNEIYKLTDGKYVRAARAPLSEVFGRGKGAPVTREVFFDSQDGKGTLWLVNGDRTNERVASAEITLNGATVVSPRQLNENVGMLHVPVTLNSDDNKLTVRLGGKRGGALRLLVTTVP